MNHFHLAERPEVATAIAAAEACGTLDELYAAIRDYEGHEIARRRHYTPSWPVTADIGGVAPIMIVTEKPEPNDAAKGRPFTGEYGEVMNEVLGWCGVDLAQVHVAYAVHWTPENEKAPNSTQISASRPFLFREIELVRPRAMIAMGRHVLESLFMYRDPIRPILGMTMQFRRGDLDIPAMTTFHPAWANRFKTDIPIFHDQIKGALERFGNPDGTPYVDRWRRAA